MKRLKCKMCGCTDFIKENDEYVCQACGTKYAADKVKNMIDNEITVSNDESPMDNALKIIDEGQLKENLSNIQKCPHCNKDIPNGAPICPICGRLIKSNEPQNDEIKHQKSYSKILEKCTTTENKKDSKPLLIATIIILALCLTYLIYFLYIQQNPTNKQSNNVNATSKNTKNIFHNKDEELYKIYNCNTDNIIFINEKGEEKLSFPANRYDYVGDDFFDGVLIVGKKLSNDFYEDEQNQLYSKTIFKISLMNQKGEIVKELPYNVVFNDSFMEEDVYYDFPIFKNGYAKIICRENLSSRKEKTVYIDKNGNEVPESIGKVCEGVIDIYQPDKTAPEPKYDFGAYGEPPTELSENPYVRYYKDGKLVIDSKSEKDCLQNDDGSRDPAFHNGIAMYFTHETAGCGRRFINKKGEFINDEFYDFAEPFYKNLAHVTKGNISGYINKKGEWVYSTNNNSCGYYR